MGIFLKDPAGSIDYAIDWGAGYLDGQTIVDSEWRVAPELPGGVAVAATVLGPTRTAATLAAGTPGSVYRIHNRVTLSDGRADERSLTIRVEDR